MTAPSRAPQAGRSWTAGLCGNRAPKSRAHLRNCSHPLDWPVIPTRWHFLAVIGRPFPILHGQAPWRSHLCGYSRDFLWAAWATAAELRLGSQFRRGPWCRSPLICRPLACANSPAPGTVLNEFIIPTPDAAAGPGGGARKLAAAKCSCLT